MDAAGVTDVMKGTYRYELRTRNHLYGYGPQYFSDEFNEDGTLFKTVILSLVWTPKKQQTLTHLSRR